MASSRRLAAIVIAAALPMAGLIVSGHAAPLTTSCTNNQASPGFTCEVYEPTENAQPVALPGQVTPGYIVLMDNAGANHADQAAWSDVAIFATVNSGSTVQLLSDPATFPSFATVEAASHTYIQEDLSGTGNEETDTTTYLANPNTYHFHSASPLCETTDVDPTPSPQPTNFATPAPLATPSQNPCVAPSPSPSPSASPSASPSPSPSASPTGAVSPAATVPGLPVSGLPGGSIGFQSGKSIGSTQPGISSADLLLAAGGIGALLLLLPVVMRRRPKAGG